MLHLKRCSYVGVITVALLWISSTALAEDSSTHDDDGKPKESGTRVKVAQAQVVGVKPPEVALAQVIGGLTAKPDITQEGFSKMVKNTQGLNEVQKSALISSFGVLDTQIKAAAEGTSTGEEFRKALEGAREELTPARGGNETGLRGAGGQPGVGEDPKKKAEQEALAKILELLKDNKDGEKKDRQALPAIGADNKGRGAQEGQNAGGENKGREGQNGGDDNKNQGSNDKGDSKLGKALKDGFKSLAKDNKKGNNNSGGGNKEAAKPDEKKDDEKKDDEKSAGKKERKRASESDTSSKKKEKKLPESTSPVVDTPIESGGNFFKPKAERSALSAITGAFNAPGSASGELGVGSGGANFDSPVRGGGGGGGGGGSVDSMRFDQDESGGGNYGGPGGFERGGIFADAGGASGGDSYAGGEEVDGGADASEQIYKVKTITPPAADFSRVQHRASASERPSIMDRIGHVLVETCHQVEPSSVGVCPKVLVIPSGKNAPAKSASSGEPRDGRI